MWVAPAAGTSVSVLELASEEVLLLSALTLRWGYPGASRPRDREKGFGIGQLKGCKGGGVWLTMYVSGLKLEVVLWVQQ
jgi:hypothetical protein